MTGTDPASRYAAHLGVSRQEAKAYLFSAVYGPNPPTDLDAYVDALIARDKATEGQP